MLNALHLLWICPLAAAVGFTLCACLTAGKRADEGMEVSN